jgi:enoyl-CoA hydratase/carnithine racemase
MHAWLDLLVRLSRAPVVTISAIRGRARGAGSEFVLATDPRFASRENTLLGQFEVATGVVPGGGPMARFSRLVGRARALEILLVADDLDGPRAAEYGDVNRVIAGDRFDAEVDAIANGLAGFNRDAIARTKAYVDQVTLPPTASSRRRSPTSSSCSRAPTNRRNPRDCGSADSTLTASSSDRSASSWSRTRPLRECCGPCDQ